MRSAGRKAKTSVVVTEIDILRSGSRGDLLNATRQRHILGQVGRGTFQGVFASPPCGSFSRARWANQLGPRPMRSREHPRGFPWLRGRRLSEARAANRLVDFTFQVAARLVAHSDSALLLREHPEDLGAVSGGSRPGTIWQWPEVLALLARPGVTWGALAQDEWGRDFRKPTRFLGRLPGLEGVLHMGPPTFDAIGAYTGPLPRAQGPARRTLVGKSMDGTFVTAPAAAWPPRLCRRLADLTISAVVGLPLAAPDQELGGQPRGECPKSSPSASGTTRGRVTEAQLKTLAQGGEIEGVYIGRGGRGGVPPSVWRNEHKISGSVTRAAAIASFSERFAKDAALQARLPELFGKRLLCHCPPPVWHAMAMC